jgi:hypothetical protein
MKMSRKRKMLNDEEFVRLLQADDYSSSELDDNADETPAEIAGIEAKMRAIGLPEWWIQGESGPVDAEAPKVTTGRVTAICNLIEKWRGVLADMRALRPAPEMGSARLSASSSAGASPVVHFSGFERSLTDIFDPQALAGELSWARGDLRIACAQSAGGCIGLLHASVERSDVRDVSDSSIVLNFADKNGVTETLELKARRTFGVVRNTSLTGDPSHLEVTILLGSDD